MLGQLWSLLPPSLPARAPQPTLLELSLVPIPLSLGLLQLLLELPLLLW